MFGMADRLFGSTHHPPTQQQRENLSLRFSNNSVAELQIYVFSRYESPSIQYCVKLDQRVIYYYIGKERLFPNQDDAYQG